jgi:hypothetical protein
VGEIIRLGGLAHPRVLGRPDWDVRGLRSSGLGLPDALARGVND